MFGKIIKIGVLLTTSLLLVSASALSGDLEPGSFVTSGQTKKKIIALTFDDGPGPFTPKFLDLLDQYEIKATFFMLGQQVKWRASVAQQVKERGHEIASHTWEHTNFKKKYNDLKEKNPNQNVDLIIKDELVKDLIKTRQVLQGMTKTTPRMLRMPHGIDRPWVYEAAKEENLIVVNWTHGADWLNKTKEDLLPGYINAIKPGAILLFHDGGSGRDISLELLEAVLIEAKKKRYKVVTVGKLLELDTP